MPLSHIRIDDICREHLEALVDAGASEGLRLEFKRELPGNSDAQRKEFLKDVSALANTAGGDIIYGVSETDGIADELVGCELTESEDDLRGRLEAMLTTGLEPRLPFSRIGVVRVGDDRHAVVIRVGRSWVGPHRVGINHNRFYARNSHGKFEMDVEQLRSTFTHGQHAREMAEAWRRDRVADIGVGLVPHAISEGPLVVMHLVPLQSIDSAFTIELPEQNQYLDARPLSGYGMNFGYTIEGHIRLGDDSYLLIFDNGRIEAVDGNIVRGAGHPDVIPSTLFEQRLMDALDAYVDLLAGQGIAGPALLFVTLLNARGLEMATGERFPLAREIRGIQRETVWLSPILIEDIAEAQPAITLLRPIFDILWRSTGFLRGSPNFDEDGNWTPPR